MKLDFIQIKKGFKNHKALISMAFIAFILIFLFYSGIKTLRENFRKLKREVKVESTVYEPTHKPSEDSLMCEYGEIINEQIKRPDPSDDVQEIIGYQNNKFGIYIYAEVKDYVELADDLVNSNGGEWGYVLVPYNVKDYNSEKWFQLFELLEDKKLIPIVQLYDIEIDDEDKINEQVKKSSEFLSKLPWPIEKRYVSVYNEPNDKNFWKGKIDPEGYARILNSTIDELKKHDEDFFVMNGAFNASARTGSNHLDERDFLARMEKEIPGILKKLDGWASHSYPQPNFSGNPDGRGRDSIRAYEWELSILKSYGVNNLPVFITETGWAHREGYDDDDGQNGNYKYNKYQVADNIKYAFEKVWLPDDRIVAVTPFTIRFNPPHDHFSWVTKDGNPMPQFDAVKSLKKVQGKPPIVTYSISKAIECL